MNLSLLVKSLSIIIIWFFLVAVESNDSLDFQLFKLKREFNWERKVSLQEGINKTINWYIDNKSWWEPLLGN